MPEEMINFPLLFLIGILAIECGLQVWYHGKARTGVYNAWWDVFATLIFLLLILWAVWWGL